MSTEKNLDTFFQDLKDTKAEITRIKTEMFGKIKESFTELAKTHLFDKYDELKSFGWTQYTPYFMDGDECIFEVNSDYPSINGYDEDSDEDEEDNELVNILMNSEKEMSAQVDGRWTRVPNPAYKESYSQIVNNIQSFLQNFDEEDFEMMFGDHVKVTVTAEATKVEKYDHE